MKFHRLGITVASLCAAGIVNAAALTPIEINMSHAIVDRWVEQAFDGKENFFTKHITFFTPPKPQVVPVSELVKVYSENELKGNHLFKNKGEFMIYTGTVGEVDQNYRGNPRVTAKTEPFCKATPHFVFPNTEAVMNELMEYQKGQPFKFACKCKGLDMFFVTLDDCFTVETLKDLINQNTDKSIEQIQRGINPEKTKFGPVVGFGVRMASVLPEEGKEACSKSQEACSKWYLTWRDSPAGQKYIQEADMNGGLSRMKELGYAVK